MTTWMGWAVLAGILLILEIFSGTFYLLMLALGFAAGALAAYFDASIALQCISAAVVGTSATLILRRSKIGQHAGGDPSADASLNLDIGQTLQVDTWVTPTDGVATARVMYRGAMWDVSAAPGAIPLAGQFVIREVRGSRLIVAKA